MHPIYILRTAQNLLKSEGKAAAIIAKNKMVFCQELGNYHEAIKWFHVVLVLDELKDSTHGKIH